VRKDAETWDERSPQLGPSRELHADYYGKHRPPIDWTEFRRRYVAEMKEERETIARLDEYQFVVLPIALGGGRTMFTKGESLRLLEHRAFQCGNVVLMYATSNG
jgi:hypothetical protein